MDLNFASVLQRMEVGADFRIANEARPPANYLMATLLPEQNRETYYTKSGSMTVRTTMAGLAAMDSPYPPVGLVEAETKQEQTAKVAGQSRFSEENLRELQMLLMRLALGGGDTNQAVIQNALNFLNKVIVQAQLDTAEYLRAQALVNGAIDWTFNNKRLQVSYGIPAGNMLAQRTGTAGYGGSASVFWQDIGLLQKALRYNVRAFILHIDTINMILANAVNNIEVTAQAGLRFSIRRYVSRAGNTVPSSDAREAIDLIGYADEGEIFDLANPGQTTKIPFMPLGRILAVGNNNTSGYVVGYGGTTPASAQNNLGYTHLAPTVEGGGRPGRWARLYTPEAEPWSLVGQGVSNILPVIDAPKLVATASTVMS